MAEKNTTPKVDEHNRDKDGEYVGTEKAPQTVTENVKADPNSDNVLGSHRYGERHSGSVPSATDDDGNKLTWDDPDAVPGTVGDDPVESMKAIASAGGAAVKVDTKGK
jgi:hypothetical protein